MTLAATMGTKALIEIAELPPPESTDDEALIEVRTVSLKTRRCSAMAKGFASDIGFGEANTALELHGGFGCLHEYGLEKVVRALRCHQIDQGTNDILRAVIARGLFEAPRS